jgi:hypothetical protein
MTPQLKDLLLTAWLLLCFGAFFSAAGLLFAR